jgi:hypothetical protein
MPPLRYDADFASRLLCRAAALRWIRPFLAARSKRLTAVRRSAGVASDWRARLTAVRRVERCALLRAVAARDLRMSFLDEAMFGTARKILRSRCGCQGAALL